MLTQRQKDALEFITAYKTERGIVPSYQEIMDGLGLKSKSGPHRIMMALEAKGFIRRFPNKARSYEVLERDMTPRPVNIGLAHEILHAHERFMFGSMDIKQFAAVAVSSAIKEVGRYEKSIKGRADPKEAGE